LRHITKPRFGCGLTPVASLFCGTANAQDTMNSAGQLADADPLTGRRELGAAWSVDRDYVLASIGHKL